MNVKGLSLLERIPIKASALNNINTVLSRLEKRGHLNNLVNLLTQIMQAENKNLMEEIHELKDIDFFSTIFKENLKVLVPLISIIYIFIFS